MPRLHLALGLSLLAVIIVGCAGARQSESIAAPETTSSQRTLRIVVRVEPSTATEAVSGLGRMSRTLFSARLSALDSEGEVFPVLAESTPRLNTDSWHVFPNGRMETTFKVRPGLVWHDGKPLTAEDFAFGRDVQLARIGWGLVAPSAELQTIMGEVTAPDPQTVVVRWRQAYAEAASPDFLPFPRHILREPFERGEAQAFGTDPYWTREYVGAGPFRLAQWVQGAFIEATAFEGYALGRPKIGRIELAFSGDPSVNVVRLLAGGAHVAVDSALQYEQAVTLRREWAGTNGGTVLLSPTQLRYLQVQHRPDYVRPAALLDLRVRKALIHAIDRQGMADALLEGEGVVAESLVPSTVNYYRQVDAAITRYPYDLRRTEQFMAEAGFSVGPDGFYASAAESMNPQVRGVAEGQEAQETAIVADALRRARIDAQLDMIPAAQRNQSDELKGTFSGLTTNFNTLSSGFGFNKMHSSRIGAPSNNWLGTNRIGYSNPEFDRLMDGWTAALDRTERNQYMVQMGKLLSEQLPVFPLYLNFEIVAHVAGLRGPRGGDPDSTVYYNLHEWAWD